MDKIDIAVTWAIATANNNSYGYDQNSRWGPSFDCSSFLITAWEQAGVPIKKAGGTYTGDMKKAFQACGFTVMPYVKGMKLLRGDVLLNEGHHTVMYIGNDQIVHASINEKGTTTGGKVGDQTGKEICTRPFYIPSCGWEWVLRYGVGGAKVSISLTVCKKGSKCPEVGLIQTLLNSLGYKGKDGKPLVVDNDYGSNTDFAVCIFQTRNGLLSDGIVGAKTWSKLLTSNYTK